MHLFHATSAVVIFDYIYESDIVSQFRRQSIVIVWVRLQRDTPSDPDSTILTCTQWY